MQENTPNPSTTDDSPQKETSTNQAVIGPMDYRSYCEEEFRAGVDFETASQARSPLPDALQCPTSIAIFDQSEWLSNVPTVQQASEVTGSYPLSRTTRAIVKQRFSETIRISLP